MFTPLLHRLFAGQRALLCALDGIFDKASVFIVKRAGFRGAECETPMETLPQAVMNGKK